MTNAVVATTRQRARPFLLIAFAAPVFALLIGLGVWQLERLQWKEGVLAQIASRVSAAPTPLPPAAQWPALAASDPEYLHVSVSGHFAPAEALVFRGGGKIAGETMSRPGYWVMAPFVMADGATLLVNRGFVPAELRDDPRRAESLPKGEITIAGLLRTPETRNMFTPADNAAKGDYFTRDPALLAATMGVPSAPFSLDEDAHDAPHGMPAGGATVFDIPNNHLSYAVTWFGLALTLVGVLAAYLWRQSRAAQSPKP